MTKLRFRLRPLVMSAAAVAALAMIAGDADARVGGNRSSGSRKSLRIVFRFNSGIARLLVTGGPQGYAVGSCVP